MKGYKRTMLGLAIVFGGFSAAKFFVAPDLYTGLWSSGSRHFARVARATPLVARQNRNTTPNIHFDFILTSLRCLPD
jgi:hypothetical protein